MTAPYGPFNGLIWPKTGYASTGLAQQRRHNFLPLGYAHSARNKKVLPLLSSPRQTGGAPPVVSGLSIAIGPQWCGPGNGKRRLKMATIGTFKKTGNEFTGEIVTLSVQAKGVRIVPDTRATGENAPSPRVLVGRAEIGAPIPGFPPGPVRNGRPPCRQAALLLPGASLGGAIWPRNLPLGRAV